MVSDYCTTIRKKHNLAHKIEQTPNLEIQIINSQNKISCSFTIILNTIC